MNFKKFHESKNLFDKDNTTIYNAYFDNGGQWILSDDSKSIKIPCQPNTEYTISVPNSLVVFRVYESDNASITPAPSSSAGIPRATEITRGTNISQYAFTTSSTAAIILFQGSSGSVTEWFNGLMLNTGSTPQPYEPYSSEVWHDIPYYQHKTATDTLTLPAVIYPNTSSITVGIKGQSSQASTPSPSQPCDVVGVGERTGNLFSESFSDGYSLNANGLPISFSGRIANLNPISINADTCVLTCQTDKNTQFIYAVLNNGTTIRRVAGNSIGDIIDTSGGNELYICIYEALGRGLVASEVSQIMLNTGSTAKPYEPYGYKIPISSGGVTTNIYLGSTQTVRQIGCIDLSEYNFVYIPQFQIWECTTIPNVKYTSSNTELGNALAEKYINHTASGLYAAANNFAISTVSVSVNTGSDSISPSGKLYYALATPTTSIVNEPLMKIDTYADTLSNATAIPTTEGTNSITVDTTVQPSEFSATWTGWHDSSVKEWDGSDWQ